MTKAYVIRGGDYLRYDVEADATDPGYPKPISNGWAGLAALGFAAGIDAAADLGTGKVYLFKGGKYVRVDQNANAVDAGYPLSIAEHWGGLGAAGFGDGLDGATNWGDGTLRFFKGGSTVRYNIAQDGVVAGYPRLIRDEFPGLVAAGFASGLDAVAIWPSGNAYFFKGANYVRLEPNGVVGQARPIAGNWPGLSGPIDALWVKLAAAVLPPGRLGPGDHVWYWNGKVSTAQDIPRTQWFPGVNPTVPTDYGGHGAEIFNFVIHQGGEIRRGRPHMRGHEGTHAWLNMNPGNITGGIGGPNLGQYPGKANWHNFMIFPTEQAGFTAIGLLLRGPGYRDLSILAGFRKYAPASDGNRPDQYAAEVAAGIGLPVTTIIRDLTDAQLLRMQQKIKEVEGTVPGVVLRPDSPDLPAAVRTLL